MPDIVSKGLSKEKCQILQTLVDNDIYNIKTANKIVEWWELSIEERKQKFKWDYQNDRGYYQFCDKEKYWGLSNYEKIDKKIFNILVSDEVLQALVEERFTLAELYELHEQGRLSDRALFNQEGLAVLRTGVIDKELFFNLGLGIFTGLYTKNGLKAINERILTRKVIKALSDKSVYHINHIGSNLKLLLSDFGLELLRAGQINLLQE